MGTVQRSRHKGVGRRLLAQRSDGYRLLFESAIAGVCLSAISRILILLLKVLPLGLRSKQMWDELSPFPFSGTAIGALLLGFAIVLIANRVWNEEWAKGKVLERYGNAPAVARGRKIREAHLCNTG